MFVILCAEFEAYCKRFFINSGLLRL